MNALVDSNPDDTVPTLKMVKVKEEPVTPPGGRSIPQRPRAVQESPGIKSVSPQQSGRPQAFPIVRQALRTEPESGRPQASPVVRQALRTEPESGQPQASPVVRQALRTEPEKKILKSFPLPQSDGIAIEDIPTQELPTVILQAIKSETKKGQKKSLLGVAVRAVVTLLLLGCLLKSMKWSMLVTTIMHVSHTFLLIGLSAGVLCIIFSAYGWRSVVLAENIKADLARLIDLYLVGISFSHFLPTSMGGDAVKAYYVGRDSRNTPGATSAVLMSRITSFVGMLLIALPALAILHAHFTDQVVISFLLLSLLLIAAILGSALVALLLPKLSSRFLKGKWTHNRVFVKVLEVGVALSYAFRRPRSLLSATLFGMLFWVASFLNYYGYAAALGLHVPLTFYAVAIPFVSIIAALPISINGFGVREGAFVYLFSTIHVPPTTSLSLALLMDAQVLLFGLIGGYIYFTMSSKKKR